MNVRLSIVRSSFKPRRCAAKQAGGTHGKADVNTILSVAKTFIMLAGALALLGATPAQASAAVDAAAAPTVLAQAAEPAAPAVLAQAATPAAPATPVRPARDSAKKPAPAPEKTGAAAPTSVVVKKGDTLSRIVARNLDALPFKQEIVRTAVIQKNPAAFKDGKPESMIEGAVIQFPTMEDFRRMIPALGAIGASGASGSAEGGYADGEPDVKRSWVRFP